MAGEANRKSYEEVQRWHRASQHLDRTRSQVNKAELELHNAENDLGKHLCPPDAEINEEFSMWVHTEELGMLEKERLVVVKKTGENDYSVTWREQRKAKAQSAVA